MPFYFRADDVPELAGLTRWEQRMLLRGTFIKERAISTLFLLIAVIGSVQFVINPLIEQFQPGMRTNSLSYVVALLAWLFLLMWLRDVIMMNVLRPKLAIKRAEMKRAADDAALAKVADAGQDHE
ncbi:MAG TPA: hypothetical protein VLC08_13660 [Chitinolyticbacter sp.]|uniref:hypothetical protein n=1 Tax=Chitinolyticbacter albus TaxID=2961951 RepID=UPI00210B4A9B|nr:hypothetical protein [Chitinolyticbacter albus]HSC81397.1 hypothetical protein [Chitinolyticbacter sp.]